MNLHPFLTSTYQNNRHTAILWLEESDVRRYEIGTNANGGNDLLIGIDQADVMYGGSGADILIGRDGATGEWLIGGLGNDIVVAGAGNDQLFGGGGQDVIVAGAGNDVIDGDDDYQPAQGYQSSSQWNVVIKPDTFGVTWSHVVNADYARAVGAADLIYAGTGDDVVLGIMGDDTLYGASNEKTWRQAA